MVMVNFNYPLGITVDNQTNNIYVTDSNNHRIQIFTHEGQFIGKWGEKGNGDGQFNYPRGIAMDNQ